MKGRSKSFMANLSLSESLAVLSDKARTVEIQISTGLVYRGVVLDVSMDACSLVNESNEKVIIAHRYIMTIKES